ncbi:MAG: chlororespiratory reduction 6 domain-containing protein, partial [Desulfamplus sp.]|nr:chlororespiratory reduction 6 domain-containing protein [Desulfamplus sp.]
MMKKNLKDSVVKEEQADNVILFLVVSKEQVESGDITEVIGVLKMLIQSPKIARSFKEKVDISFYGYDHDPRELYQIPEVSAYIHKLDAQFPYWLYFLSKHLQGLRAILYCLLPPDWEKT